MGTLRSKTLAGVLWGLAEKFGVQLTMFVPGLVLARLLTPKDYGLIGMLALFVGLAQVFIDSGLTAALIQKPTTSHVDECSVFYVNLALGSGCAVALGLGAPLIARFYDQPILVPLARVLALTFVFNSLGLIQTARLARRLEFRPQVKASYLTVLVSSTVGIGAAWGGCGVWSLAYSSLAGSLTRTLSLWALCPWRPTLEFSRDSLRGLFGFGWKMLASGLVGTTFQHLNQAFIGKVFSPELVGVYARAASLKGIVLDTTSFSISRAFFPALASIQDDPIRLQRGLRAALRVMAFFHIPLILALCVVARPLIVVLFSARWAACVPLFQLMCLAGLLFPLHVLNLDLLKAKGRSDLLLRLEIAKRALSLLSLSITWRWGVEAILLGEIANSLVAYVLNSMYTGRLIGYSLPIQIVDCLPSLACAAAAAGGMALAGRALTHVHDIAQLAIQGSVGILLYCALHWTVRSAAWRETVAHLPLVLKRHRGSAHGGLNP